MRLFVAITPDARAAAEIEAVAERLRRDLANPSALRWVGRGQHHLTLHFLGEIGSDRRDRVIAACGEPLDLAPVEVALSGIGCFPPAGPPRAVWLGLVAGLDRLLQAHAEIGRRLAAEGLALESRPFSPHLTLARVRRGAAPPRLRSRLAGLDVPRIEWRLDRIDLLESDLSGPRPAYATRATMQLRGDSLQ